MRRWYLIPALAAGLIAVAAFLPLRSAIGASKDAGVFSKYLQIPGAKPVGEETCATCHADVAKNFQHAFHKQQGVECEDCHGNGSLHVEGGGDVAKIVSLSKRSVRDANGVCLGCHSRDEKTRHWMGSSHDANHLRCVDCHQIHYQAYQTANESRISFDTATRGAFAAGAVSPETNVVLRPLSATNDACLRCHQTQDAQLSMPYHHPLREGKMSCVDCHDPHGGPAGNNLRTANTNQLCLSCHAQYRGPFAYQHPPVTENCMICHSPHGSPNTNLLSVSQPALCLQCHAGHHNGASLPIPDRCTNCHGSIHGTDVATPTGGSRFIDKGPCGVPSEPPGSGACGAPSGVAPFSAAAASSKLRLLLSHMPTIAVGTATGALGMLSSGSLAPLSGGNMLEVGSDPAGTDAGLGAASSASSITPATYRFLDGSGFLGRVGEYDSLQQSAGADAVTAYVSPQNHITVVSRGNVVTGDDYSTASQLTVGKWLKAGFDMRGFVQQQDHYPLYAFQVLDIPPGTPPQTPPDTTTDLIPPHAVFGVKRRLGNAYAQLKVPKLPAHLFVNGNWQARSGVTQLAYQEENATNTCNTQCHLGSQFQNVNYTTRNVGGGGDIDLGQVRLTYQHKFSSFNDRLIFPTVAYQAGFLPSGEGPLPVPPSGPDPNQNQFPAGNYYLDIPSPSQSSSDGLSLNWTASPKLIFNGGVSYTRLHNTFTHHPQNWFDSDETLNWRPLDRLRVTADYHQHNVLNNFTPYYSMYGDVSYHNHWEGLKLDYELPKGFDVEVHYKRNGITRSNASLWQLGGSSNVGVGQFYSIDNTDLLPVVTSSFSNNTGLTLRYHDGNYWSARLGYEWTGTHHPGYLTVPGSDNRIFADVWFTPRNWLTFANDISIIVQNAFPAVPLQNNPGTGQGFGLDIAGLPPTFQRRDRFYFETASATLRLLPGWNVGLGYSYQQNNLTTYMAFQNDSSTGYILDEPDVPYKQITQAYWGESTYALRQRLGLNFRVTYNSSRSGMRPDVNPLVDPATLGNAYLISQGIFDPNGLFTSALGNLQFTATQISDVRVPQWIGQSKVYYRFPDKFEGGLVFYYGSYRDYWNNGRAVAPSLAPNVFAPNLNGDLRTFSLYVGRKW